MDEEKWFGYIERMGSKEFVKSESGGPNSRGKPSGRWRDRVKEYMCERGATKWEACIKQGGSVWTRRD